MREFQGSKEYPWGDDVHVTTDSCLNESHAAVSLIWEIALKSLPSHLSAPVIESGIWMLQKSNQRAKPGPQS